MRCGVLHRMVVVTFAAAILYGGRYALASEAVTAPAKTAPPLAAPLALPPGGGAPAPAKEAPAGKAEKKPQAAQSGEPEVPHIALLLPLDSPPFVKHAEAVRNGFIA